MREFQEGAPSFDYHASNHELPAVCTHDSTYLLHQRAENDLEPCRLDKLFAAESSTRSTERMIK